jgi:AraC-like DNA-binding protein
MEKIMKRAQVICGSTTGNTQIMADIVGKSLQHEEFQVKIIEVTKAFEVKPEQSTIHWAFDRLRVSFRDLDGTATLMDTGDTGEDVCRLVMCLKGGFKACTDAEDQIGAFLVPPGCCSLLYRVADRRCLNCGPAGPVQVFEMVCPASTMVEIVSGTRLGRELAAAVQTGRQFHFVQPITPKIQQALIAFRESAGDPGRAVAAFVLAKAFEMVGLFAGNSVDGRQVPEDTRLAVGRACAILEKHMTDPPPLHILASSVGMSLSKFKQVFPAVCGMPPYAYLRSIRMERAMCLLSHRGASVTDAAFEVGYDSLSHFAKTFSAHHGIKPSGVRRGP